MTGPRFDTNLFGELAKAGKTCVELAEIMGMSTACARVYAADLGVALARKPRDIAQRQLDRISKMKGMHAQGVSLAKIGLQFGLTRERVRQILSKQGITRFDGGASMTARTNAEQRERAREARYMAEYGMPFAIVKQLRSDGVTRAYQEQERNASFRGVGWTLNFAQWFAIWQASGKLHLRGRGIGKYVMSRIKDDGPYAMGNVHIQLAVENSREAVAKWRGKVKENRGVYCLYPGREMAWLAKVGRKRIGFYPSELAAVSARDAYLMEHGLLGLDGSVLGSGRGWTLVKNNKSKPYMMQLAGMKSSSHATAEEAAAAYRAGVALLTAQRASQEL